jgi:hypothetical protein
VAVEKIIKDQLVFKPLTEFEWPDFIVIIALCVGKIPSQAFS